MSEEENNQLEDNAVERPVTDDSDVQLPEKARGAYFTRRNAGIAFGLTAIFAVLLVVLVVLFYRNGVADNYIKAQFVAKMAEIGVEFDADVFRVTINPLELELKNATFTDRITGEKLFFIRDARLGLTVQNLYAWQLSRDISIDKTDITGAEVWVKFDENGKSNFSNLTFIEDQPGGRVNFKYDSVNFSMRDSVIHFGDVSRNISADANNVVFLLEPENYDVSEEQRRYKFDLTSTDSNFVYDGNPLAPIDIRAVGIASPLGMEISQLRLTTPAGEASLNGTISDWEALKYNLNIESTVDLTQTSSIFPLGTAISGIGNFKGIVTGEGENYKIDGSIDSQSLTAEGIYLRGVNVAATVEGTNSMYEANGTAVAELLTFEDFRIDFPKLTGNVRGTGTDFRWVGELQAAAAKTGSLTLGGLFLSDAVAEYKDRQLATTAGTARVQKFSVDDREFANLVARNLKFSSNGGVNNLTAQSAQAASLTSKDFKLNEIRARNIRVKDNKSRTDVDVDALQAQSAQVKGSRLRNVTADTLHLTALPNSTELSAKNLRAGQVNADGTSITGLYAPDVTVRDTPTETIIYSDALRVARVETGAATLGSLNIAGVRLTIRDGRIDGRSNDIDAGTVKLAESSTLPDGGTLEAVTVRKPVFVLEPSGRYRASADMSLGGGIIGNIPLGAAQAKVNVNNDRVELNEMTASVMDGQLNGNAIIAFNNRSRSGINADFSGLDLAKVLALQGGRVIPLEGQTTGSVNLSFNGTDFSTASGTINSDIAANAGDAARGTVPVNGRVQLSATNGLFNVDLAKLNTEKSELSATGRFDLRNDDSNLNIALNSADASEIDRLIRVLGLSPELERQFDSMQVQLAGNLTFNGSLTGNFSDPVIDGRAAIDSVSLRGREIGSVSSDIFVAPAGIELRNGRLLERDGGNIAFNASIPNSGANNISVQATLTNVDAGNLLAALPLDNVLPQSIRDFNAQTSGTVNINGLPNQAVGEINLSSTGGSVSGQAFDQFSAKANLQGTLINLENFVLRTSEGFINANGTYDRASTAFDFNIKGENVQLAGLRPLIGQIDAIPAITGIANFTAKATGLADRTATYDVNFSGSAREVVINDNAFGVVNFSGNTANQVLTADLTATLDGRPQVINASVNFGDENLPFRVQTEFNQSPLGPFVALIPQLKGISISGTGTGRVEFGGNLSQRDTAGNIIFSTDNLTGSARFSQLALQILDTPLVATEPVVVTFNPREITFESARFAGGGSNVTIAGTKAVISDGINNLSINGRVNLSLLNAFPQIAVTDTFFGGLADVSMRFTGTDNNPLISGTADLQNASLATFIGSDRLTFNRLNGRIVFSSNGARIERATGFLGGGEFVAGGEAAFGESLQVEQFRLDITGTNVTVPLPEDFITTGDIKLQISGGRGRGGILNTLIAGNILARRSLYTKDIDLANVVGGRREGSLSSGSSSLPAPRFDLTIEGRDALVIRNNIADLTASISLRLTGTTANPQISGRVTANSGTVFFRSDRYIVQRGVLEFPPNTDIDPIINLQAESEIGGYQIFVNLSGPLTDTEMLNATVRSSPALPQADVISLITTGNLSNTEAGLPILAQTGINTAADILTDAVISNPARRATNRLFGLNVFEIDPIISGRRLNPSARLTVGRQINNNLRITYATNLSADQNQVLALEYRVSNKLSFVAQYEQRSLSNVTQDRNNFSFEVRFRKRF